MKKKKININDLENIKQTFENNECDNSTLGLSLIDKAMFCYTTLNSLEDEIEKNGVVTEMCQGNYSISRENPALKSYSNVLKNYQSLVKQITSLLPDNKGANIEDEFGEF